ncbi:hypothetical protein H2201_005727 [Coniosporium apollinis]|uniref:Uncharacterized protein n=1 Tax=Coniosporium apollinis TaxID=61459 RepID=A0ABQ9NSE8_9PEZI|nr:hypothetical protein H2201_005727 [Coniosporium apollinis]
MRRRETYPTAPDLTDGIIPTAPSKDRAGDRQRRNSLNSGGFRAQPYPTNRDVRGGVRSNPDGSQIRTSTVAGNSGFIARTFTNTNMANFFEHNKNLIPMAMVFYFPSDDHNVEQHDPKVAYTPTTYLLNTSYILETSAALYS